MTRFGVRVKPGAKREAVGGSHGGALVVAVTAPAIEGKANEAVRKALAKAFGVRKQDVTIVTGERGRDKIVEVPEAAARLQELLSSP
ncbi:DUF167 domain-containing protein [Actinophytocola sp.]|uniref:DUF167 domain-containing protein n=1 Tax=Actinophytocola sp. TaxID=1872138 RepID=UPI002ED60C3D